MIHAYLWQCPITHNTAAVLAHSASHARRWFANNTKPKVPWRFIGIDNRQDAPSTPVVAVLDSTGKQKTLGVEP